MMIFPFHGLRRDVLRRKRLHVVWVNLFLFISALCTFFSLGAVAVEIEGLAPPARVGQLALVSGNVLMRLDRASLLEPALLNAPITSGSALVTQIPGRTEARIGSAALRLGQDSRVAFTEINDSNLHVEIGNGLVSLRVRALVAGERVVLTAGGVAVQILSAGAYRFRFGMPQARLRVWVLEGQARIVLSQKELMLGPKQQIQIDKGVANQLVASASEDHQSFDEFTNTRERISESAFSQEFVPAEMTGAEALDGHGSWREETGYGAVWFPSKLPMDWAPYRFGRWRWLAPWGWNWVDEAPWGFAPFHYGRWLFAGGRWGWVPRQSGAVNVSSRPVYAPALVGFFGNQSGAVWMSSVSSSPVVGWYPLAPNEMYWPAYNAPNAYVRALNAASVNDVAQIQAVPAGGIAHRFARTAFAASAMPFSAFVGMQDVAHNQIALPPAALAQAPLTGRRVQPPSPIVTSSPTQAK